MNASSTRLYAEKPFLCLYLLAAASSRCFVGVCVVVGATRSNTRVTVLFMCTCWSASCMYSALTTPSRLICRVSANVSFVYVCAFTSIALARMSAVRVACTLTNTLFLDKLYKHFRF